MDTLISTYRRSMQYNPILQPIQLGRPKKLCMSLPGLEFTYGKPNLRLDGGTAEALSDWYGGILSPGPLRGIDYRKVNVDATRYNKSNLLEQRQYRSKYAKDEKYLTTSYRGMGPMRIPDITFGRPYIYSENAASLVQYVYFSRWLKKVKAREHHKRTEEKPPSYVKVNVRKARTPRYPLPEVRDKPWKMSRFLKVPHRVSCWNEFYRYRTTTVRPAVAPDRPTDNRPCLCLDEKGTPLLDIADVLETTSKSPETIISERHALAKPESPNVEKGQAVPTDFDLPPRSPTMPTSKLTQRTKYEVAERGSLTETKRW